MDPFSLGINSLLLAGLFYVVLLLVERGLVSQLKRKVAYGEQLYAEIEVKDLDDPADEEGWNRLNEAPLREPFGRRAELVTGSVVMTHGLMYQMWTRIRSIFGGNIGVLDELVQLSRRLAVIRMKDRAAQKGYRTIVRVRLESAPLLKSQEPAKPHGLEIVAYGTAVS